MSQMHLFNLRCFSIVQWFCIILKGQLSDAGWFLKSTISLPGSLLRWHWVPVTFVWGSAQKKTALTDGCGWPYSRRFVHLQITTDPGTAGLQESHGKGKSWLPSFKQFCTTNVTREWSRWFSMAMFQGQVETHCHSSYSFTQQILIEFPYGRH